MKLFLGGKSERFSVQIEFSIGPTPFRQSGCRLLPRGAAGKRGWEGQGGVQPEQNTGEIQRPCANAITLFFFVTDAVDK